MSPAPSSDRDAMFATSAELDDGALAELREFTAAFERRLADAPPTESVPAGSIARGRLPGTRDDDCTQTRGRRRTLRGRRNKKSTSALKTKATTKQEENGSPLTDSNRRPPPYHERRMQPVATHGNGSGLFLRFLRTRSLPLIATGCNHGAP